MDNPICETSRQRIPCNTGPSSFKKETERFLNGSLHQGNGYRASCYRPSLEKLSSMTFEQYIRVNVLGVHLPGFDAEDSCNEEDDQEEAAEAAASAEEEEKEDRKEEKDKVDAQPQQSERRPKRVKTEHNTLINCNVPLQMDPNKYTDGIAKITPPKGWWSSAPLSWEEGTPLGDTIIPSPIQQRINGIGGVYEFTMLEVQSMTVAKYKALAEQYRNKQVTARYRSKQHHLLYPPNPTDQEIDELARFYWKRLGPTMEPSIYGADMEGTLFGDDTAHGWNVGRLDTCLQLLRADPLGQGNISGVTSPYLYFGMWASTFAAHKEDMNLCSINYLHDGAPKYWYAIAAEDTERFETLMASYFSHASNNCKEFMRHKRYLISPAILNKAGISYTTQVQRAGDFIITFPGCYHFGFNTGFNVAESTNFAIPEWLPIGQHANICMCVPDSVRIDMSHFKEILNRYNNSTTSYQQKKNGYIEWSNADERKRKDMRSSSVPQLSSIICKSDTLVQRDGFIVDVYKRTLNDNKNESNKRKKKTRSQSKVDTMIAERRLARICGRSSFVMGTHVICLLPSSNQELKYHSGIIEKCIENNVKIHFDGSSRQKDLWMPLNSPNLFIDGGRI